MTDTNHQTEQYDQAQDLSSWGTSVSLCVCEVCDWGFVVPEGVSALSCPHCFRGKLSKFSMEKGGPELFLRPPELILDYSASSNKIANSIQNFTSGHWFAPADLTLTHLQERLKRVFVPMWMVDTDIQASWQAETGFNYEVVSHRDRYSDSRGGWESQEVKETRIRWEPRVGTLSRKYQNIPAPAFEDYPKLAQLLGDYSLSAATPYNSKGIGQAYLRLPNRSVEDAWPDAVPLVMKTAVEECQQAARADHIREFKWAPEYCNQNWTLLLLPAYTSYYLDDEKIPHLVLLNGQSGKLTGKRKASMRQAQKASIWILLAALILFLVSLAISAAAITLPALFVIGGLGVFMAILVGLMAIIPIAIVWRINRQ